jgi:hypothetical protein
VDAHISPESALWIGCGYAADKARWLLWPVKAMIQAEQSSNRRRYVLSSGTHEKHQVQRDRGQSRCDGLNCPAIAVEQTSMAVAFVSIEQRIRVLAPVALLLSCISLGACAVSTPGLSLMDARAETPTTPSASIQKPPPPREKPAMTLDERVKVQKELNALRDSQKARAARPEPTKP